MPWQFKGKKYSVYRLVAGSGVSSGPGYTMFAEGRPGGMASTARGRKVTGVGTRRAKDKPYRYRTASGRGNAYYAIYVELGTRRMAARPFLRPAVIAQRAKVRRLMRKMINDNMPSQYRSRA